MFTSKNSNEKQNESISIFPLIKLHNANINKSQTEKFMNASFKRKLTLKKKLLSQKKNSRKSENHLLKTHLSDFKSPIQSDSKSIYKLISTTQMIKSLGNSPTPKWFSIKNANILNKHFIKRKSTLINPLNINHVYGSKFNKLKKKIKKPNSDLKKLLRHDEYVFETPLKRKSNKKIHNHRKFKIKKNHQSNKILENIEKANFKAEHLMLENMSKTSLFETTMNIMKCGLDKPLCKTQKSLGKKVSANDNSILNTNIVEYDKQCTMFSFSSFQDKNISFDFTKKVNLLDNQNLFKSSKMRLMMDNINTNMEKSKISK